MAERESNDSGLGSEGMVVRRRDLKPRDSDIESGYCNMGPDLIDETRDNTGSLDLPLGTMLREQPMASQDLIGEAHRIRDKMEIAEGPKRPNILLVGMQGAGKSSLINSLNAAVDKTGYHEIAMRGNYGSYGVRGHGAVSLDLRRYKLFKSHPKGSEEHSYKCQPVLWDCPGLQDVEDENISAILNLILEGCIPDETNMTFLRSKSARDLYRKYSNSEKKNCIDIVLYVHAATDPVPENLLAAIRGATQKDLQDCRKVPVVVVITKIDKIDTPEKRQDFQMRREELTKLLGVHEVVERIFEVSLYCKQVTPEMKRMRSVDVEMCRLWHLLLDPVYYTIPKKRRTIRIKFP